MLPFVSVIIPAYNRASIIKESILSVCSQDYPNYEIIVIDDGSSDNLIDIIKTFNSAKISYNRLSKNKGQSYARNVGVSLASGSIVAFQDSDDIWTSNRMFNQVQLMYGYDFSFGRFMRGGNIYPSTGIDISNLYRSILSDPLIGTPTLFCVKDVFVNAGGFCENYRCFEDYDLSLRLSKNYSGVFIDEILLEARDCIVHVGSEDNASEALRVRCDLFKRYYADICKNHLEQKWIKGFYGFKDYCDPVTFSYELKKIEMFINNNSIQYGR